MLKKLPIPRLRAPRPRTAPGALNPHLLGLACILAGSAIAWFLLQEPSQSKILLKAADHIDYSYDLITNQPATSPDRQRDLKILVQYRDYMKRQSDESGSRCLADVASLLATQAQQLLDLAAPKAVGPIELEITSPAIRSAEAKRRLAECP